MLEWFTPNASCLGVVLKILKPPIASHIYHYHPSSTLMQWVLHQLRYVRALGTANHTANSGLRWHQKIWWWSIPQAHAMFGAGGVRMFQTSVWFNYSIYFLCVLLAYLSVSKWMMVFNWFICLGWVGSTDQSNIWMAAEDKSSAKSWHKKKTCRKTAIVTCGLRLGLGKVPF